MYKPITSASLSVSIALQSAHLTEHFPGPSVCRSVGRSVCKVYCGKTANWIWMSFGVVSGVGRRIGVLDGVVIGKGEGSVLG